MDTKEGVLKMLRQPCLVSWVRMVLMILQVELYMVLDKLVSHLYGF